MASDKESNIAFLTEAQWKRALSEIISLQKKFLNELREQIPDPILNAIASSIEIFHTTNTPTPASIAYDLAIKQTTEKTNPAIGFFDIFDQLSFSENHFRIEWDRNGLPDKAELAVFFEMEYIPVISEPNQVESSEEYFPYEDVVNNIADLAATWSAQRSEEYGSPYYDLIFTIIVSLAVDCDCHIVGFSNDGDKQTVKLTMRYGKAGMHILIRLGELSKRYNDLIVRQSAR